MYSCAAPPPQIYSQYSLFLTPHPAKKREVKDEQGRDKQSQQKPKKSPRKAQHNSIKETAMYTGSMQAPLSSRSLLNHHAAEQPEVKKPLRASKNRNSNSNSNNSAPAMRGPRISRWAIQEIAEVCDDQVCTQEIQALPQLAHEDLEVQGLLGEGGFCSVFQVKILNGEGGARPLALKQLRRHKRGREEDVWVMSVYDLCNEISLLARLASHENIVTIMGVCKSSVSVASKKQANGYFFVMEKLEDTLCNRLNAWRKELKQNAGRLSRLRRSHSLTSMVSHHKAPSASAGTTNNNQKGGLRLLSSQAVYQRLSDVAIGIARAMCHLHSADFQIALRDLKPGNIGFDENGTVKLFDFGMARPVHETDTAELAGTFRYISPEAILGHRIGLESDVHSFGIVLYELVTLLKPFDQYFQRGKIVRKEAFIDACVVGGWRPSLSSIPCRATRRLIAKCWDPSPRARPCFDRIYFLLNRIVTTNTDTGGVRTADYYQQPSSVPSSRVPNDSSSTPLLATEDYGEPPKPAADAVKKTTSPELSMPERVVEPPVLVEAIITPDGPPSSSVHKSRSSFRGLFRSLKPLTKQKSRVWSDITAETTSSRSIRMLAPGEDL